MDGQAHVCAPLVPWPCDSRDWEAQHGESAALRRSDFTRRVAALAHGISAQAQPGDRVAIVGAPRLAQWPLLWGSCTAVAGLKSA